LYFFMFFFFFFFFQAEDGIRDKLVTGVQTCALPILPLRGLLYRTRLGRNHQWTALGNYAIARPPISDQHLRRRSRRRTLRGRIRSEERRVGKEWRSEWST